MNRRLLVSFGFAIALFISGAAQADLLSPYGGETAANFAELVVLEDRVRVVLEIDPSDYPKFVAPDDGTGKKLSARTGHTLTVAADGVILEPVIRIVDLRTRKPRVSAARPNAVRPERSDNVVYAELEYPFEGRPKRMTFTPPLDSDAMPAASIGIVVEHAGVPVTDYRYLSRPETLVLDWSDPWFSAFENRNLTRHHKSPLMSFLAMEPREVRHEVIVRLRDIESWIDLDLGDSSSVASSRVAAVEQRVAAFFAEHNPLVIDETAVRPTAVRVSWIEVGVEGLRVLENPAPVNRATALLGIVLFYPWPALPHKVAMTWELFPEGLQTVPVTLTDPAGGVPSRLTVGDPEVTWVNFLKTWEDPRVSPVQVDDGRRLAVPVLAVGLIGLAAVSGLGAVRLSERRWRWAGLAVVAGVAAAFTVRVAVVPLPLPGGGPDREAAVEISEAMLRNAATALLETGGKTFETALTEFVSAESIGSVGTEIRRGLAVTLPSGARARTDAIEELTVEEITRQGEGLSLLTSWTARVSGGHWGHLHQRKIQYRALLDVAESKGLWKLSGLTVMSAKPVT